MPAAISEEKLKIEKELNRMIDQYERMFFVKLENVTSQQMHRVRRDLLGQAEIVVGKKTTQKKIISARAAKKTASATDEALAEKMCKENLLSGNIALCFTNKSIADLQAVFNRYRVQAPARVGAVSPVEVIVPAGNTGMEPTQTSFFQALNIATKIVRGSIEIVNQVHLIKKGDKITSSAVALLAKLDIKPFFYGIVVLHVYEKGAVYPASVLDVTQDELLAKFVGATNRLRALSLAARWPSELTLSYHMASGFRKLLALSLATNYKIDAVEKMAKAAAAAPAAKPAGGGGGDKKEGKDGGKDAKAGGKGGKDKEKEKPAAKPAEPEPEPDEGGDVGMPGLFD